MVLKGRRSKDGPDGLVIPDILLLTLDMLSPFCAELKREAEIWKRSADRLLVVSAEEKTVKLLLMQKAMTLENIVRNMKRTT